MRVVTLLPAATEIVAALGAANRLVGISHECDFPPAVLHLPRVTGTAVDPKLPGAVIDAGVVALRAAGKSVIRVDAEQLRRLAPALVITQGICEVCAVGSTEVRRLGAVLEPTTRVLSLDAQDLAGIWADIRSVGQALDLAGEAEELVAGLTGRLERLTPSNRPRLSQAFGIPRFLCIEWLEPLYLAGHWVPELVMAAGGEDVGAEPGGRSTRREWSEALALRPDLVLIMLCGFDVARAEVELATLADPTARRLLDGTPTWVLDGNAYTARPGPRVVEGAERIQAAFRGEEMEGLRRWNPPA